MKTTLISIAALLTLVMTGCGAADDDRDSDDVEGNRYSAVDELKKAAVTAGLKCDDWSQDNAVSLSGESGVCNAETVLSTYVTMKDLESQREQGRLANDQAKAAGEEVVPLLVGPNWIIISPDAPKLAEKLGGTLSRN